MTSTFYWSIYKNLENEFLNLSNYILVTEDQLTVYSLKIADLLVRTVVEIEAISKQLFDDNGGSPQKKRKHPLFDEDCINFLVDKWKIDKRIVNITSPLLLLTNGESRICKPLEGANKKGDPSVDWKDAYQAVKHDRMNNLEKGNVGNLLHALAALYLLNVYHRNFEMELGYDNNAILFDASMGSDLFSVNVQRTMKGIVAESKVPKDKNYESSVYLIEPKDEGYLEGLQKFREMEALMKGKILNPIEEQMKEYEDLEEKEKGEIFENLIQERFKEAGKPFIEYLQNSAKESESIFAKLEYTAVLNKNQF